VELRVLLGARDVGVIRSQRDGRIELAFSPEYLMLEDRPVLGQYFEDHLDEIHRNQTHLPPFFSNLLPEGGLRELVARRAGLHRDREAHLIAVLGEDLPGAVVVRRVDDPAGDPAADPIDPEGGSALADSSREEPGPLRFSLAGTQLKFSVLYHAKGRGPTLPVDGRGGNWIAKLPSETFANVPEHEYEVMQWAGRTGIAIPEVALVTVGDIDRLPIQIAPDRHAFLSRRFDRPAAGGRIHQEDFAQVANVRAAQRYGVLSHTSIARIVRAVAGEDDFDEVIRRTVFNVLLGNGDAHLKNWSLTYPDGVHARLSPAYDLVATVTYLNDQKLGLKLSGENRFDQIRIQHFERLAEKVGVPGDRVTRVVRETVQRAMATWPENTRDPPRLAALRAHVERLPLLAEAG
jgi:serine/threonine-protein kinase HipA